MKMETSDEVMDALKKRYPTNGYVLIRNVANGIGNSKRYADAIVMSLFKSRGLYIYGFEIKVSRQDWVHELKHPEKADIIAEMCDGWYLVTGDPSIVKEGELPETWGLLTAKNKDTLISVKEPVFRKDFSNIDRRFLAAILARLSEQATPEALLEDRNKEAYQLGFKKGTENKQEVVDNRNNMIAELRKQINDFEESSGIRINDYWNPAVKVGELVRAVLDKKYESYKESLLSLKCQADDISKEIGKILHF